MKLMILDGNSIANRAFYGIKLLSTREGLYTNAVYGFITILNRMLDEESPDALCVAFDRHAPTFRSKLFPEYKQNRTGMPIELRQQMPVIKEVLTAMNIPMYELDGWEADDVIGTVASKCEQDDYECVIVTGDKDELQLVSDKTTVKLVTTRMGKTQTQNVTPQIFNEMYGFEPEHLIDLKALMGDTSDNYPGVKGIGEKTAISLIQKYKTIAYIYENLDNLELKPAQRKHLNEGEYSAKMCYNLATIRRDAPIEFNPKNNIIKAVNKATLYNLFCKLEFTKLIKKYQLDVISFDDNIEDSVNSDIANDVESKTMETNISEIIADMQSCEYVCLMCNDNLSEIITYLPDKHLVYLIKAQNLSDKNKNYIYNTLFSDNIKKITHDCKPLMNKLLHLGYSTDGFVFDTILAAYLLNPTAGSYDLDMLCQNYCAISVQNSESDKYSKNYVVAIDILYKELLKQLNENSLLEVLKNIELPLCPILAEMELEGFLVDKDALEKFGVMLEKNILDVQENIYSIAGEEFNINSPKQLGEVLFEKMELPVVKKTKRGYSTSAEILEKLRDVSPIIDNILDYRQLTKLKSTYVDGLSKVIDTKGRIHTNFQNTVTATGRLSSTEPNLQNIPVRTELGSEIRKMFIASDGCVLVDADYSQIELRILAHMSNDNAMIESFCNGGDIHTATAASIYNVPLEMVTKQMRSSSKAINFGIVYGMSFFTLAEDLKISRNDAKKYMEKYFAKFPNIKNYQSDIVKQAKTYGYVTTLSGRRRWIPELKSTQYQVRQSGERIALNTPVQGTAADIIKLAMIRVQKRLKEENLKAKLVLQVHDELIIECPENEGQRVAELVQYEMENAVSLKVPLIAEAHIGHSWSDAH